VLQYWKANATAFPHAADVAWKYLSVPATSTASRQFSASGRLVTKLRSSLAEDRVAEDRVESLIFLHENM